MSARPASPSCRTRCPSRSGKAGRAGFPVRRAHRRMEADGAAPFPPSATGWARRPIPLRGGWDALRKSRSPPSVEVVGRTGAVRTPCNGGLSLREQLCGGDGTLGFGASGSRGQTSRGPLNTKGCVGEEVAGERRLRKESMGSFSGGAGMEARVGAGRTLVWARG